MRAVHPMFHVSMLKPATPNTFQQRSKPPPAPVIIDGEPEYKISKIVNSKIDRGEYANCSTKLYGWDMKILTTTPNGYQQQNWNTPKN